MARAENARRVAQLRALGLSAKEVMQETAFSRSYVYELINDPAGERVRARKESYRGVCESCGAPTDGSNGPVAAPLRCMECIKWTDEEIIEAIRAWAAEHGGKPPTTDDWSPATEDHPVPRVLIERRGWNAYLLAAGFEPNTDRRPKTQAEIERLIAEGHTLKAVAERFGCTPANIGLRLYRRGKSVRMLRAA